MGDSLRAQEPTAIATEQVIKQAANRREIIASTPVGQVARERDGGLAAAFARAVGPEDL